jgi:8-amino-7-oxononanoate synthase
MTAITTQLPLLGDDDYEDDVAIFSDALNHASIIDGIRLSRRRNRTKFEIYKHCDVEHLNQLL